MMEPCKRPPISRAPAGAWSLSSCLGQSREEHRQRESGPTNERDWDPGRSFHSVLAECARTGFSGDGYGSQLQSVIGVCLNEFDQTSAPHPGVE